MISGTFPFTADNLQDLNNAILTGEYYFPDHLSNESMDLISRLLVQEPTDRLSIHEILKHPWLCEVKLNKTISFSLQCFFRLVEIEASIRNYIDQIQKL